MKIERVGRPVVEYVDGQKWRILHAYGPWGIKINLRSTTLVLLTEADNLTDFGSIPSFAWQIVGPPTGFGKGRDYGPECAIHDYLYENEGVPIGNGQISKLSRKTVDIVFKKSLIQNPNVDNWRAHVMYWAVRVGGGKHYGNRRSLSRLRGYKVE